MNGAIKCNCCISVFERTPSLNPNERDESRIISNFNKKCGSIKIILEILLSPQEVPVLQV